MPSEFCVHLQPLVDAMKRAHIEATPTSSPYGDDNTWWACHCTFDAVGLRRRLGLDPCVTYHEYNGMAAGSDATWTCSEHNLVLMGPHPHVAPAGTPRVK